MLNKIILSIFILLGIGITQEIEGRWIPGGFGNTMYIFEDGLRYTIYNTDSNFEDIDIEDAIPNPNPYTIDENTLIIDLFFGNEATYTIDFRCDGQVVDFYYDEDDLGVGLHSTMFRESFDDFNNECLEPNPNDCLCTEEWNPVCGIDGNTYSNACYATCEYVVIAYEGECLALTGEIEGRWHLVGYEDAIMYQFVDTEPFADAGLRYSIYVDENGEFDDLDGDNIGGTPHPYSVVGDIITIDTHFGNILSYQMNYRCDGQVVDFVYTPDDIIHSTLFREFYDYSQCQSMPNECSLTTDDILGPYYFEDVPFRSVIAHEDEPGQRLVISGKVRQNDCENSISGSLIEVWQANDEGCYGIVEDCDTGNPENDYFNLRGKFFSDSNGNYSFESILPGYYGSRPRHIHIKITTPNGVELISQLYFENDPSCENDPWCQDADDRIISLVENEFGLFGSLDLIMDSLENGIILGDLNNDEVINVQDIVLLVSIVIDDSNINDFQIYSGDFNADNNIDVLDIVQLVNIIINN